MNPNFALAKQQWTEFRFAYDQNVSVVLLTVNTAMWQCDWAIHQSGKKTRFLTVDFSNENK